MTKNEKLARKNIQNCINADHDAVVKYIYDCAVSSFYVGGGVFMDTRIIAQIKFLGKKKLMEIVEELVSKEGY